MFNDIGTKIKRLAAILCWLGIIGSLIFGIIIMVSGANGFGYVGEILSITIGFLIIIVGSLASWIGSFKLYGYGQLIEDTSENKKILEKISKDVEETKYIINATSGSRPAPNNPGYNAGGPVYYPGNNGMNNTPQAGGTWRCSCGKENSVSSKFCSGCGKPRA